MPSEATVWPNAFCVPVPLAAPDQSHIYDEALFFIDLKKERGNQENIFMKTLIAILTMMIGVGTARAELVTGEMAPAFKIDKVLNAPVSRIKDLKSLKGKVVFLDFWATWCPPCVASLPHMNKLVKAMKGQPVVIIAVADEPTDTIKEFVKTHPIDAWIGIDLEKNAVTAFNAKSRPQGYLIGKDGKLLARISPGFLQEQDLLDAVAGKFTPKPIIDQNEAPVQSTSAVKTYLEMKITSADGKFKMSSGGGKLETQSIPLQYTIAKIWDVQDDQVIIDSPTVSALNVYLNTSYDNYDQARELLKSALQSSLGIKVTPEQRETDVYLLTLSTAAGAPRPKPAAPDVHLALTSYGGGSMVGTADMDKAAQVFWSAMDKPVIDATSLKGGYEFDMQWKYRNQPELAKLLADQGLTLVPGRSIVDFLRVTPVKQ